MLALLVCDNVDIVDMVFGSSLTSVHTPGISTASHALDGLPTIEL